MAPPKVRADYEQLKDDASRFASQAASTRQTLVRLKQQADVLKSGDWVGQGAAAFYQEMGDQVVPAIQRLATALESAQQTTLQISQIMAQAEAEAARVLRGSGNGAAQSGSLAGAPGLAASAFGAGGGPGLSAAPAPGPGSGSAGGSGSGAPAGGGPATPQELGQAVRQQVDTIQASFDDNMAAAAARGAIQGIQGSPPAVQDAVIDALLHDHTPAVQAVAQQAAEEVAVDRKLAGFNQPVRDIAKLSPTLRNEVLRAGQRGFDVINDPTARGFGTGFTVKRVVVGTQGWSDAAVTMHMAHEISHGANDGPKPLPLAGETEQHYVARGIDVKLHDEGRAELNNVKARMEILAAGGPDIGRSRPAASDPYQSIYNDITAGHITWDQGVDQASSAMGNEIPSMDPTGNYRDMYRKEFTAEFHRPH